MKKAKTLGMIALFVLLIAIIPTKANASTTKALELGKTYSFDLNNDGKKEKVKYTIELVPNSETGKLHIFINGKKQYTKAYNSNAVWVGEVYCTDFNKKDNYMDIYTALVSDSECFHSSAILRYQNKKLKVIATKKYKENDFGGRRYLSPQQKGDGTVLIKADTPFYSENWCCYYVDMKYKIKNNTLVKCKQNTYNVSKDWKEATHTLNKTMTFTKTRTGKAKAFTAKSGTVLYLNKVYCTGTKKPMYLEMKTSKGKTGWTKASKPSFFTEYEMYFWG